MVETEKKKLTLSVDSEIIDKAKDLDINISEITEKVLRAFTTSSETADKEKLYKNYQDLFRLMSRLLRKFRVKTSIGEEQVLLYESEDPEDLEEVYGPKGEVIGYEDPNAIPEIFHFYLEPSGSLSHDHYDIKDIKKIPIEAFYRPQEIIDKFLEAIQEGVNYRKDQFKEIDMAKTIIDAITKGTISKVKSKGKRKRG